MQISSNGNYTFSNANFQKKKEKIWKIFQISVQVYFNGNFVKKSIVEVEIYFLAM